MRCDDYRASLLEGRDDGDMRRHVAECAACQAVTPNLATFAERLDDGAVWQEPAPELRDTVIDLVTNRRPTAEAPRARRPHRVTLVAAALALLLGVGAAALTMRRSAPDWEVPIAGTELAPTARGVVKGWNLPNGTKVVFEVEGLGEAPDGTFYEVWFSEGPIHISAGTAKALDRAEFTVAVPRNEYPRIWVTVEPIDDDESPAPTTVLDTRT